MRKLFLLISVSIIILSAFSLFANAQNSESDTVFLKNPLQAENIEDIIDNIIDFILTIAIFLGPLLIIIGGFLFITGSSNVEQINRGKRIIIWTTIGFLIILLSKGVVVLVKTLLGVGGQVG
ncbi:MAG: hypothetical protein KJI71_04310 [Patescibacteria group bacterium]|nr:hypothetical protein [Patescibacteria group bacterium]